MLHVVADSVHSLLRCTTIIEKARVLLFQNWVIYPENVVGMTGHQLLDSCCCLGIIISSDALGDTHENITNKQQQWFFYFSTCLR